MDSGNGEICEASIKFEHFDVVQDVATDHYFIKSNKSGKVKDSTSLSIMKEWKILKKNLPESIYVQVYESRIDLVRAVIVGPAGTPYHDGLFFFDIFLPSDYPNTPPKMYYHSHGHRLNPNLYANGTVCLSLINTWFGSKVEKWRKESTILQLLVSIQGLVLNERPYFNEPGYAKATNSLEAKWIKASNSYSEEAFMLSCKTMMQIMREPPKGFVDFVAQHFRERSGSILGAVNAYEQGHMICFRFENNGVSSSSSAKFKASLRKIRPDLAKAFGMINSEKVVKFEQQNDEKLDLVNRAEMEGTGKKAYKLKHGKGDNSSKTVVNKKKTGFWGKIVGVVNWIFD